MASEAQAWTLSPVISTAVEQAVEPLKTFLLIDGIDSYIGMFGGDGIFWSKLVAIAVVKSVVE